MQRIDKMVFLTGALQLNHTVLWTVVILSIFISTRCNPQPALNTVWRRQYTPFQLINEWDVSCQPVLNHKPPHSFTKIQTFRHMTFKNIHQKHSSGFSSCFCHLGGVEERLSRADARSFMSVNLNVHVGFKNPLKFVDWRQKTLIWLFEFYLNGRTYYLTLYMQGRFRLVSVILFTESQQVTSWAWASRWRRWRGKKFLFRSRNLDSWRDRSSCQLNSSCLSILWLSII